MKKILMFLLLGLNIAVPLVFSGSKAVTVIITQYDPPGDEQDWDTITETSVSYSISAAVDGYGKAWAKVRDAGLTTIDEVSIPQGFHDDAVVYHSNIYSSIVKEIRAYCKYDSGGYTQKRSYANATVYW